MAASDFTRTAPKFSAWYAIITLPTAVFQAWIIETARGQLAAPWARRVEAVVGDLGFFAFLVLVALLPFWLCSATGAERRRLRWAGSVDSLRAAVFDLRQATLDWSIDTAIYARQRIPALQRVTVDLLRAFPQPSIAKLSIMDPNWSGQREPELVSELQVLAGYADHVAAQIGHQQERVIA